MGDWRWVDDPQPERPDPLGRALRACERPRLQHEDVLLSVDMVDVPLHDQGGADLCFRSYCVRTAAPADDRHDEPVPFKGRVWRSRVFAVHVPITASAHPDALTADLDAETVFRSLIDQVEREVHSARDDVV